MRFDAVRSATYSVPFISVANARHLYDMILKQRIDSILELGIGHGTATCYMAAALEELGGGKITAVDLASAEFTPTAEEQLASLGLGRFVDVVRMQTGYNWFLHNEIRDQTIDGYCQPKYGLCIVDGPKNWTIDGCAFFLVDKLLKREGWIIFDDYDWTYAEADLKRPLTDGITHRLLSEEERNTPHIREVFELLVQQHESYSSFVVLKPGDWAMAQKQPSSARTYTVKYRVDYGSLISRFLLAGKQAARQLRAKHVRV